MLSLHKRLPTTPVATNVVAEVTECKWDAAILVTSLAAMVTTTKLLQITRRTLLAWMISVVSPTREQTDNRAKDQCHLAQPPCSRREATADERWAQVVHWIEQVKIQDLRLELAHLLNKRSLPPPQMHSGRLLVPFYSHDFTNIFTVFLQDWDLARRTQLLPLPQTHLRSWPNLLLLTQRRRRASNSAFFCDLHKSVYRSILISVHRLAGFSCICGGAFFYNVS